MEPKLKKVHEVTESLTQLPKKVRKLLFHAYKYTAVPTATPAALITSNLSLL